MSPNTINYVNSKWNKNMNVTIYKLEISWLLIRLDRMVNKWALPSFRGSSAFGLPLNSEGAHIWLLSDMSLIHLLRILTNLRKREAGHCLSNMEGEM